MIKDYELMVMYVPTLNQDEANLANEALIKLLTDNGAEIIKTDSWGKRMLAYEIEKYKEAHYFVNYFKLESLALKGITQLLNINESIMRHMFVAKEN